MNSSPLENLHQEFTQVISNQNIKSYLGPDQVDPTVLKHTSTKSIRLAEVFTLATQQIKEGLNKKNGPSSNDIVPLRQLQTDGKTMYERYTKATNTWSRWFLKGLARITPEQLKAFLPACFSNKMEQAEIETQDEYEKYRTFIREKITKLSKSQILKPKVEVEKDEALANNADLANKQDFFDPLQDKAHIDTKKPELKKLAVEKSIAKEDDEDVQFQKDLAAIYAMESKADQKKGNPKVENPKPSKVVKQDDSKDEEEWDKEFFEIDSPPLVATLSKEDIEKAHKKEIEASLEILRNGLKRIDQFAQYPLSLQKYTNILMKMVHAINVIIELDPEAQSSLEKVGIKDKIFDLLNNLDFKSALYLMPDKLVDVFESTPWHHSITEASTQKSLIKFGISKIAGQQMIKLADVKGSQVKEKDFQNYRGSVQLILTNSTLLSELEEFVKFLDKYPSCRPCNVVIKLQDDSPLTPEFFQLLMKLKDQFTEIKIEGVQEINFKTLAVSEADEHLFIQHLETFQFPDLKSMTLSDHSKKDWSAKDFSHLLAFYPTIELLKESCHLCTSYQDIIIPKRLSLLEAIDFTEFAVDQIPYLLSQCNQLTHVNLNDLPITDAQLLQWIKQGFLANIKTLQLEGCQNLTTDSLPALAKLPKLTRIALPDLPQGKMPLNKLPKFDNPFKINMLYTTSKITQPFASGLYRGLQLWASIFQIPLARQGVAEIFAPDQKRLDPKSVAYWLHKNDYQYLKPQISIRTIVADSNGALTDANIVEFVQKFPEVSSLSLYNCPNVSNEGIIKLLKACPKVKTLDLMGCRHITEDLFLTDGHFGILKNLNKLMIADTGISKDIATAFKEEQEMLGKIVFEETTLSISDDDLTDDDALEKILEAQKDLTKLKRIDLEGCTKLNNKMLGQLLDHLNAPILIQTIEGAYVDNPQRLNLAVLNLKGCINITDEAFDQPSHAEIIDTGDVPFDEIEKFKIETKLLENLDRIVTEGTKISEILKQIYPAITFQEVEEPITIHINEEVQLQECLAYHEKKALNESEENEQKELKKLTACYLHNRIVVELFCEDEESAQDILEQPIQPSAEEFCDFTLIFKENDDADPSLLHAHRDALYCQSLYFLNRFRPGGVMSKIDGVDFTNVHATPEAVEAVKNLLNGKSSCIENLDWKTAADVAELVGPKIFNLGLVIYKALLARIHSQFSLDEAPEMLESAAALNDEAGKKEYEDTLLLYLNNLPITDEDNFQIIVNLGEGYGLKKVNALVKMIQNRKNKAIEDAIRNAEAQENDQLVRDMIAAENLGAFV